MQSLNQRRELKSRSREFTSFAPLSKHGCSGAAITKEQLKSTNESSKHEVKKSSGTKPLKLSKCIGGVLLFFCYQIIPMVLQQKEVIALQQFKQLLLDKKRSRSRDSASDEIYICGVRLELDAIDDRTDVILLKFLRVSDLKVDHAFNKLSHNILWRKKFGIDKLLLKDEDETDAYSNVFGRAFFMSGRDREGHLVWYTVCGAFQDMELYDEAFSDEAKKQRFLKWRIMFIERTMRKLNFRAGGISSIVHVIDMKNFSGLDKTASEAFLSTFGLLSNYYPDFIERQIMINVPWLDLAAMSIINPFLKRRGNRKVVFVGPSKSRDTLLRRNKHSIGIEKQHSSSSRPDASQVPCYQPIPMVLQQEEIIALQQFKQLLIDEKSPSPDSASDDIYFCGVRLQLDAIDDKTDVILLKFLRGKHFKVQDAFNTLSCIILWRKKFGTDKLHLEDEDDEDSEVFERAFFRSGRDKKGQPVFYTLLTEFHDEEVYQKTLSNEANRQRFLKWKMMLVEKTMRTLDFSDGGISGIVHVIDMKNYSSLDKTAKDAYHSTSDFLLDYYPYFVDRQIMINVSWWELAAMSIINPIVGPYLNTKVVFAGTSKYSDTLKKYVGIDQIPARPESITKRDGEFEAWDAATESCKLRRNKHFIGGEAKQPFLQQLPRCIALLFFCYQPIPMVLQQKEIIALQQFKQLLIDRKKSESPDSASDDIHFCGVRLQLDAIDDRTDVILLKFLRAKDFEVQDAFNTLSSTILWRKKFGTDKLHLEEEDDEYSKVYERVFFRSGRDKKGHPVLYSVLGEFHDMEVYEKAFSDEANRQRFLKWKIMLMEKTMRTLDFSDGGISRIVHVIDVKNSSSLDKTVIEAFQWTNGFLLDYFPNFVERQIMINVPLYMVAILSITSPFMGPYFNTKFAFARPSKSSDTLKKYVGIEQIPARPESIKKRDGECEAWDAATQSCKLRCEIKSMRREISCRAKSKEGSSSSSTSIFKKKID
ncbi:PATL5 [Linum grandiflorum]